MLVLLFVCPAAVRADVPTPDDAAPAKHATDNALRRSLDQPVFNEFLTQWKRCLHDYQARKFPDLLVDLGSLKGLKANTGVKNFTPIARALMRMALEMVGDPENADMGPKLAAHARILAPDIPSTYLVTAQLSSGVNGEFSIGDALKAFSGSVFASWRHLPSILENASKIAFIWFLLTILVVALFSFSMLARYSRLLAHDIGHLFPAGATGAQMLILTLLLLFIPFLLDMGVVLLFMVWWVFLWLYMNRSERAACIILLVIISSWPFAGMLLSAGVTPPDSTEITLARCNHEVCAPDDIGRLADLRAAGEGTLDADYTLALASYRAGAYNTLKLDDALVHLSRPVQSRNAAMRSRALALQANAYFSKGVTRCIADQGNLAAGAHEFQEADNLYQQSIETRESVEALYNRGRLLFYRNMGGDGDQLITKARNLKTRRILEKEEVSQFSGQQEFLCGERFNHNRELLIPLLPVEDFFTTTIRRQSAAELLSFHHQLLGPLPLNRIPLIAGALAVVLILLGLVFRRVRFSCRCVKCGAVSDPKDRPELSQSGICETCLFYRIRGSFVDPKEIWRREKGIEIRQRLLKRIQRGVSFILPGLGQMLQGRPVRGVVFFGAFFPPVLAALVSDPLIGNLPGIEREAGMPTVQIVIYSLVALVVYLLALLDIYSRD